VKTKRLSTGSVRRFSGFRDVRYPRLSNRAGRRAVHNNRFANLIESYRLATKERPPTGYILVRNLPDSRGFRAWWTKPGDELVLCDCEWRPDLGKHYRVQRPGSSAKRFRRRRAGPRSRRRSRTTTPRSGSISAPSSRKASTRTSNAAMPSSPSPSPASSRRRRATAGGASRTTSARSRRTRPRSTTSPATISRGSQARRISKASAPVASKSSTCPIPSTISG
jgi:hypothetical protein